MKIEKQETEIPFTRTMPVGAEMMPTGGVHFRVWAPVAQSVILQLEEGNGASEYSLTAEGNGYWSCHVPDALAGQRYRYKLDDRGAYPDPASRFQPDGPHAASAIVDPSGFRWSDDTWQGVDVHDIVLYELHIGTFTAEGTYRSAAEQLPELAALGVTMLEILPLAEFDGRFGWGYDGVAPFAPYHHYGTPDDLRFFIDRAHAQGIGVIIDVVYNHFGPSGSYHRQYSEHYFSKTYRCEWGESLNFDDAHSGPVREYFISNAAYWIREFHFDGLRIDATHFIHDRSPRHVIGEITEAARKAGAGRRIYIVGENEPQDKRALATVAEGGFGIDSLWNDDYHHACNVALRGKQEAYFHDYRGAPQEFVSAIKYGYLFQGQWYGWQGHERGTPVIGFDPARFVHFIQNHDQVANSGLGRRIHEISHPGDCRAVTAQLLLGPQTPLLFQGQEYGASSPFLFFADHEPELASQISSGRREFLHQFPSLAAADTQPYLNEPHDETAFYRCKLDHRERVTHAEIYALHKDLLKMRSNEPAFADAHRYPIDGAVLGERAFLIRFFAARAEDTRVLIVNYGPDLMLLPMPEPLLAPPEDFRWQLAWSSDHPKYGGAGVAPFEFGDEAILPAHAAIILKTIQH